VVSRRRFLRSSLVGAALLGAAAVIGRSSSGYRIDADVARRLRVLSPKEYLIFIAVARRILAPDAPDAPAPDALNVGLFVDGYLARLDAALRDDLRALLHLVEHASGPLRLRASRFTHMSDGEKDAALAAWQSSRLALRRQGLQALRALAFLGYYRDARTWPMLGYTGPMLPAR
jgi:hypothetical protein